MYASTNTQIPITIMMMMMMMLESRNVSSSAASHGTDKEQNIEVTSSKIYTAKMIVIVFT